MWQAATAIEKTQEDKLWLCLWSFYRRRHPVMVRRKGYNRPLLPDLSTAGRNKWMVRHYIADLRALHKKIAVPA